MREAKTILDVLRERGRRGLPLERVYRLLFNRDLFLMAYGRIYRNDGALSRGVTEETVDGMTLEKIDALIEQLRFERHRWAPVRRISLEQEDSSRNRLLGIPTWSDKLLQGAMRLILEAYYEPQFSDHSHGFRPGRGCHTALSEIYHCWKGTTWFIEGDISDCFNSLDHGVLLSTLKETIHDNRFLRLIDELLKAGCLEDWRYHATHSGTPQGSVVSPILANVYLDRLDRFVETTLLPLYNRGTKRKANPEYSRLNAACSRLKLQGKQEEAAKLRTERRRLPSLRMDDPDFRRLKYVRYADDFLLGFAGPRSEAEEIKRRIREFLQEQLKLELSEEKARIRHARTEAARFLGYDVVVQQDDAVLTGDPNSPVKGRRRVNAVIGLKVPAEVIKAKCRPYMQRGDAIHRKERTHDSVFSIVAGYQMEYRGIAEYYRLASNLHTLNRLKWIMEGSLTKTLAHKLRISVSEVYRRFETTRQTPSGPRKVLEVKVERENRTPLVARWGGISLERRIKAVLVDRIRPVWNGRTELEQRLLAETCEICGSQERIQVHHVRRLSDLNQKGRSPRPAWVEKMAARQRKTLVVCQRCHYDIHAGWTDRSATHGE